MDSNLLYELFDCPWINAIYQISGLILINPDNEYGVNGMLINLS